MDAAGPGVILLTVGTTAECPAALPDDLFAQVEFTCLGPGDAAISLNDTTAACVGISGHIDITNDPLDITIHGRAGSCCTDDEYCQDSLWCSGYETCDRTIGDCLSGSPPCDDSDECTLDCTESDPDCGRKCSISGLPCKYDWQCPDGLSDLCTDGIDCDAIAGTCNPCDVLSLSGPGDPCCSNPACSDDPICLGTDEDRDGTENSSDNCFGTPNGPYRGTCISGTIGEPCISDDDCGGTPNSCSMNQEDTHPDVPNDCGDACECEADLNGDGQVEGLDTIIYKAGYPRSYYLGVPCAVCIGGSNDGVKCLNDAECPDGDCGQNPTNPCIGDLNCDMEVSGLDTILYKEDYPRTEYLGEPCPECSRANYPCEYPE